MAEPNDDEKRLKQLQAAEEELQRRRERGKLSQRAFRKRQSKASQDTREQNEKLKAAIEELVRVAGCNDRPELRKAIRNAALIAGVDARELDGPDDGGEGAVHFNNVDIDTAAINVISIISGEPDPAITIGPPDFYPPTAAASSSSQQRRRPLSPRLDYGLWFEGTSFMRLVDPPLDIVPYLGEGMYTLAGRINWACTEYLVGVCRRVAAASSLSACSTTGRSIDPEAALRGCAEIRRMVQHSPPLHDVRYVKAMAETRLDFRRRGYILVPKDSSEDATACAGKRDSAARLQRQVERDYAARGQETHVWATPEDVAQHVRAQLGDKGFARLEDMLRYQDNSPRITRPPGYVDGDGHSDDGMFGQTYALLRLLIQNLAESFVCFGDGPRWRADRVAALFTVRDWEV
ncbi:hypothetical protein UCREL1_5550 [Eutypa lata UCREL1]|uniref:BZIP domain-containing protein n=1 Tax=Eutypa lata (strain UCR-EL1) TaxID=1287681 RepID=M7SM16_EUTLA|nr:hypothetical protein UCREL1_5550 [Eutypa lata UCREL1]